MIAEKNLGEDTKKSINLVNSNENEKTFIPDSFFGKDKKTNESFDFDLMGNISMDDDGILSLLQGDPVSATDMERTLLPDLNEIIDISEDDSIKGETLSEYISIPELEDSETILKEEVAEVEAEGDKENSVNSNPSNVSDDGVLNILALKFGIDPNSMSKDEIEAFVGDIASVVMITLEQLSTVVLGSRKIKSEIGVLPKIDEAKKNPILQAKSMQELLANIKGEHSDISKCVKDLFDEINMHNMAFYGAYKNINLKNTRKFSPKNLYHEFYKEKKLKSLFKSKKRKAWEAYEEKFGYLDDISEDKLDMSDMKKEYGRMLDTIKIGYNK